MQRVALLLLLACGQAAFGEILEIATSDEIGEGSGAGRARAIGFKANDSFSVSKIGIYGQLSNIEHSIQIFTSNDGSSVDQLVYTTSQTFEGDEFVWNDMDVEFSFSAGQHYIVNWQPLAPAFWASALVYYRDSGLPEVVGPMTVLDGISGRDANTPNNTVHALFRFDIESSHQKHTCLPLEDKLKCFGSNTHGQLGLGDSRSRGNAVGQMNNLPIPNLGQMEPREIHVAGTHSCAIDTAGRIKCWGNNKYGQLGLGDTQNRGESMSQLGDNLPFLELGEAAQTLALGKQHSCALLVSGKVKCWGSNEFGQLGQGDGNTRGDEPNEMGANLEAIALGSTSTIVAITSGDFHNCALFANDRIKCWGRGSSGQLGHGMNTDLGLSPSDMGTNLHQLDLGMGSISMLTASGNSNCALSTEGKIKCWGHNDKGQLGLGDQINRGDQPNQVDESLAEVDLGHGQVASQIDCGFNHCCAIFVQKTMKCWGDNSIGQLGLGDLNSRGKSPAELGIALPFIPLEAGTQIDELRLGFGTTCIRSGAKWKCWGKNTHGQLGQGDNVQRGGSLASLPAEIPFIQTSSAD